MIRGIGTDLVLVSRIEAVLTRQGERFARRILTADEFELFAAHGQPARYLAKRFAAKEAILKALGTGLAGGLSWQHMQIDRDELGAPQVVLSGVAADKLAAGGGGRMLLSLSDEREQALAFAVWSLD
ncbi:holo-ACP synthase [Pseudomonas abyssi]|jgi:holo-[acyl-carrier protein] synthase|uniref:Holo-[acyl-carrier-protein] synthase n=1 Tax=Pseudomonas abyssi TaxID=170540 RepID=A0A2A3MME0_9PSED|nr:holo-ACP synthase [Pseudomonas abyssi]MAC98694.1 holo-ACP synthase [Pseudomonadales bacterium]PBK05976.1 holo-ACP synthase [Pseudomonas abyssi]|tara:strand:+ start:42802 stop:43182 length:381 start_codon:yes stop_codon:yes gene_type:complete